MAINRNLLLVSPKRSGSHFTVSVALLVVDVFYKRLGLMAYVGTCLVG